VANYLVANTFTYKARKKWQTEAGNIESAWTQQL